MVTNISFRTYFFLTRVNICARTYIKKLHFSCDMICIIVLFPLSSNLSIYTFFDIEVTYL